MGPNDNSLLGYLYIDDLEVPVTSADLNDIEAPGIYEYTLQCGPQEFTFTSIYSNLNWMLFLKLCGAWNVVVEACPNKRVRHLIKYGKNEKIIKKNFHRAIRLIRKEGRK